MSIVVPLFLVAGTDLSDDVFRKSPDRRAGNVSWGIFLCPFASCGCDTYIKMVWFCVWKYKEMKPISVSATKRRKKLVKKCKGEKREKTCKKACKVGGDVVLYLSAKRWDKRMTSETQLEVKRKEPIDARKSGRNARDFRDAPSSVRNEKLRKNKAWQKTASVVK